MRVFILLMKFSKSWEMASEVNENGFGGPWNRGRTANWAKKARGIASCVLPVMLKVIFDDCGPFGNFQKNHPKCDFSDFS